MNIRTRLAPTGLRLAHRLIEGRLGAALALAFGVLLLAGCSTGSVRESRVDQARDAGLPDHVAAEQATRTLERYFPPTGTPAPTEPPAPALGQIALTFGFRPDGTPDGSYASVPAGAGSVYVATRLTGLSVGQKVRAVVTDAYGRGLVALDHAARRTPVAAATPVLLDALVAARQRVGLEDEGLV